MDTFKMKLTALHPKDGYYQFRDELVGREFIVSPGTLERTFTLPTYFMMECDIVGELPSVFVERGWDKNLYFAYAQFEVVK